MTDIPNHRRSPLDHGRDAPDLSDEALVRLIQMLDAWGEVNAAQGRDSQSADMAKAAGTIAALRAQLAREREAGDALAANLENCLKVLTKEDERLCCDGRECGCYGATMHQEAEHYAEEALAAFRAAREGK